MSNKYFTGLNYTLGNEDTMVEIELVKFYKPNSIFSICGSGGRSLPLSRQAQNLTIADLSNEQLKLAMLREATYKQLSYQDFLTFWNYLPFSQDTKAELRKNLFENLEIDVSIREYFFNILSQIDFDSLLYLGKWERTFLFFSKIVQAILGPRFDQIFKFDNLNDQRAYYQNHFPHLRWKMIIFMLGNKALFNALLYKGDFIEKNCSESHFTYYHKAFTRLFTNNLAQNSFFLNLVFYGKINSLSGLPIEASLETYQTINQSKTKIQYINEDFISFFKSGRGLFDFLSLSDVPSYFKSDLERNFMQIIKIGLNPGAIIVIRYYLRIADCDLAGFVDISKDHAELIASEKVQMYTIRVYRYEP